MPKEDDKWVQFKNIQKTAAGTLHHLRRHRGLHKQVTKSGEPTSFAAPMRTARTDRLRISGRLRRFRAFVSADRLQRTERYGRAADKAETRSLGDPRHIEQHRADAAVSRRRARLQDRIRMLSVRRTAGDRQSARPLPSDGQIQRCRAHRMKLAAAIQSR